MKIEVMVDKDNTHFSYKFDCDKVIDGHSLRSSDDKEKLVILKKIKTEKVKRDKTVDEEVRYETIAVFNVWTFWRIIDE